MNASPEYPINAAVAQQKFYSYLPKAVRGAQESERRFAALD
jgi:hypothetical protein